MSVNPFISTYTEGISGRTTQKDLGATMELIYAYFTGLNYNPAAFNAYKEKQSAMLNNLLSNPQFYFSSEHAKFMNQKNPRFIGIIPMEKIEPIRIIRKLMIFIKISFQTPGISNSILWVI